MKYEDEVLKVLIKMPLKKSDDMKNPNPKPLNKNHKNYQAFVDAVKWIVDAQCDIGLGFIVEFNKDYSAVIKKELYVEKPKRNIYRDEKI